MANSLLKTAVTGCSIDVIGSTTGVVTSILRPIKL